jgi:chaperonin GroEL (HSP60 family)
VQNQQQFEANLDKICAMGVNLIVVDRGIDDLAEQIFSETGIVALERVSHKEINKLCKHTGARKLKRNALNRPADQLAEYLGHAQRVVIDRKMGCTYCLGGKGEALVTVMVGAATEEVVDENERIARDAAAAVQVALQDGVVAGGGAIEIWIAQRLEELARESKGMISYGILCVKEALLKPFACIAANAGFNPLEKMADVIAEQKQSGQDSLGLDCDHGQVINLYDQGIIDPAGVKIHAVKAAGEVAIAILRINTIIKMREGEAYPPVTLE